MEGSTSKASERHGTQPEEKLQKAASHVHGDRNPAEANRCKKQAVSRGGGGDPHRRPRRPAGEGRDKSGEHAHAQERWRRSREGGGRREGEGPQQRPRVSMAQWKAERRHPCDTCRLWGGRAQQGANAARTRCRPPRPYTASSPYRDQNLHRLNHGLLQSTLGHGSA